MRLSGVLAALLGAVLPIASIAQECVSDDKPGCPAGLQGKCPLGVLFEDFITTPSGYVVPPVAERPFNPEAGDKVLIKRFVVEGVTPNPEAGITQESVQAVADASWKKIADEKGEVRLTVGQMVRVADEVTTFYRNQGYLVAKAFVPVQAVGADSTVKIQVLEGRVSEVEVTGAADYSKGVLGRPSAALVGNTPTRDSVEAALLYTQDYPGVRLFGTFKPGAQTGDTKLVLQVLGEDSFEYAVGGDNYGLESTGQYRFRGDASWNNPIGFGDRLSVTLLQAVAPENTTLGSASYRTPVGIRGLGAYVGASKNEFRVSGDDFGIPDRDILEGTLSVYEVGTDWRFKRSRFFNADVDLNLAQKEADQLLLGTVQIVDTTLNVAALRIGFDRIDTRFKGLDMASVRYRQGFNGTSSGGFSTREETEFGVFDMRYNRVQPLTETQTMVLRLRAQETSNRLSSLEKFVLTGPDAVRAYQVGDALRDSGQFAALEYRVQAPGFARTAGPFDRTWGDLLQFWLFADYAHGENSGSSPSPAEVSGYGLAIQFGLPGSFQILLQSAQALSDQVSTDGQDSRLYGEFSVRF